MKTIKIILFSISVLFVASLSASVTASKSTIKVVRDTPYSVLERYHLSDENSIDTCDQATSNQGVFTAPSGAILGVVTKSLSVLLSGPGPKIGDTRETLRIPYSVIKKAENLGLGTILYNRSFNFTGPTCIPPQNNSVSINIKITGSSSVALRVNRIQLYFKNRRADIAVDKNQKLSLNVDLKLYGKGTLKGYWEVDGRILSRIYKQIYRPGSITLSVPKVPGLPTYETGTHRVRFVVTYPELTISTPQAIYFVREKPSLVSSTISLLKPKNRVTLDGDVWEFAWKPLPKIDTYLIEFYKKGEKKPLFSALSKSSAYTVPSYVMKKIFSLEGAYTWRVIGYNSLSNRVGNSQMREFSIK